MKKTTKRKVPNLNIHPIEITPPEAIVQADVVVELVHGEVLPAIQEALKSKKSSAVLFQINSSDAYLELPKSEWLTAIDTSISHFSQKEKYELCNELSVLKSKLNKSTAKLKSQVHE